MAGSTVVISCAGTDITQYVMYADAYFESQMGAVPGTFSFRCKDRLHELSFVTGQQVTVDVDGTRVYGGYLTSVLRGYAFPAQKVPADPTQFKNRIWQLSGVNYNILLDKRVLRNTADYLSQITALTGTVTDGEIIRDHLAPDYLDLPGDLDMTTFVDDVRTRTDGYTWLQQGTKFRDTINDLVALSGALVYIDGNKAFHHHEIDTTVKRWGFSDQPNYNGITDDPGYQGATIGPREIEGTEDGTQLVNDAFIWGGSEFAGTGGTVFSRTTDATSISEHDRWQLSETHFGELGFGIQSGVDTRSALVVDGSPGAVAGDQNRGLKYTQWKFKLAWFAHRVPILDDLRNHIVPGELVTFSLYVFGDGGDPLVQLLPLRSVRLTFPTLDTQGNGYVRFDGDFGLQPDDPYTLWRFLLGIKNTIVNVVSNQAVSTTGDGSTSTQYGAQGYFTTFNETPDGSRTDFTIPFGYISGTSQIEMNGLGMTRGLDYFESDPAAGGFTFSSPPLADDTFVILATMFA